MTVLLETIHGSRLYGLAHANSDNDTYRVVAGGKRARQTIQGSEDLLVISLSEFVRQCQRGVPQALEALYSPVAHVDLLGGFRTGFVSGTEEQVHRYGRTIRSFLRSENFKRRRHAIRLAFNLASIVEKGYFNPTLTEEQAKFATEMATLFDGRQTLEALRSIAPVYLGEYDVPEGEQAL